MSYFLRALIITAMAFTSIIMTLVAFQPECSVTQQAVRQMDDVEKQMAIYSAAAGLKGLHCNAVDDAPNQFWSSLMRAVSKGATVDEVILEANVPKDYVRSLVNREAEIGTGPSSFYQFLLATQEDLGG